MSATDDYEESTNASYSCKRCKKTFACKRSQMLHKKEVHNQLKSSFQCKICNKYFCNGGNLDRHLKVHTDVRPYACRVCGKAFSQSVNLQRHYSVHNGERPYQCQFCSKAFTQLSNMQRHQLIHTGEKPFGCSRCGRYFSQRVNLKKHILSHLETKPFACKICKKSFIQMANLRRHLQAHIKEGVHVDMDTALKIASEEARHSLSLAAQKEPTGYECAICRQVFEDFGKFEMHEVDCNRLAAEAVDNVIEEVEDDKDQIDLQSTSGVLMLPSYNPMKFSVSDMLDTHEIIVETSEHH